MQRLFTMFPHGLPGFALLLLRASVAIALLLESYGQEASGWMHGIAIVLSVAVCAGYLTPIAAVMGLVVHGIIWSGPGTSSAAVAAIVVLDAMALSFLGPGAYSLDSQRYGRRVVVLPPP